MTRDRYFAPEDIGRWSTVALGIGGILSAVILFVAIFVPDQRELALRSWLLGVIFWGGIGIGSIGILLLQYLTGGAWGVVIRRIMEASSRTIPIVILLFVPIAVGVNYLYAWTNPGDDKVLMHRQPYMSPLLWMLRAALYFGLWMVMQYLLNKWSRQQDESANYEQATGFLEKMSRFSGPTMVIFVLAVSFAVIDWVMTLDPHWYSTMWGFLFVAGWGLSCFAFAIAMLAWLSDREPMRHIVTKRHFHDLGKLMLALVMVWAYFNFSQLLIIYSGNLPEETEWYLTRMSGVWGVIGWGLVLFHFVFPFLILLSRDIKRQAKWIALLAIFILVMRLVDMFYLIAPSPRLGMNEGMPFEVGFSWMYLVAPFAVGGIWLWWFFGELRKRPLVPINDPFLENAIKHGREH